MEGTVDTPTPVVTSEPSPAAPATSAPAPSSTASQRPSSMKEAFEQVAAAQEHTVAGKEEAAAIAQPAAVTPAGAPSPTPSTEGPIPFAVHKTALDNARIKARDEALADWKPYEAIRSVPPEVLNEWIGYATRLSTDPVGYVMQLIDDLQRDARYAPQLRSHAGRVLAAGRSAPPDTEPQPDVQIVNGEGQVTGLTYSDKRLAERDAFRERQLLAKVDAQYGPLKTAHDASQHAAAAHAESERAIALTVDYQVAEIRDIVEDDKWLPDVNKAMAEHPDWSTRKAALHVRDTQVVSPRMKSQAHVAAVDALKQKAAGNTASGTGSAAPPTRPTNAKELAKWMEAHAGG